MQEQESKREQDTNKNCFYDKYKKKKRKKNKKLILFKVKCWCHVFGFVEGLKILLK